MTQSKFFNAIPGLTETVAASQETISFLASHRILEQVQVNDDNQAEKKNGGLLRLFSGQSRSGPDLEKDQLDSGSTYGERKISTTVVMNV